MDVYKVKIFRASENQEYCQKFIKGHVKILEDYGITNITTNEDTWTKSANVFAITAEEVSTGEVVGGIRIHVFDGQNSLPFIGAISDLDERCHSLLDVRGVKAEICGMWNSRRVFGLGISAVIGRASVAYAQLIGVNVMYCLAAKYILELAQLYGFRIIDDIGNHGTFIYPIETHLAHMLRIPDIESLEFAESKQMEIIAALRDDPNQERVEDGLRGQYIVKYEYDV